MRKAGGARQERPPASWIKSRFSFRARILAMRAMPVLWPVHSPSTSCMPYRPGGPADQPFGRPQRAARENHPVGGAMGDLDALAGRAKVTVCSPTMSPARTHRKADAARLARRARHHADRRPRRRASVWPRARGHHLAQGERRARGRVALHAVMRLADFHVVAGAERRRGERRQCATTRRRRWCSARPARGCAAPPARLRARCGIEAGGADQQRHARPRRRRSHARRPRAAR